MHARTLFLCLSFASAAACAHNKGKPAQPAPAYETSSLGTAAGTAPVYPSSPGGSAAQPGPAPASDEAYQRGYDDNDRSDALAHRDQRERSRGLGTAYGEQRHSRVVTRSFVRGSDRPDVTLALRYNDAANVAHHNRLVDSSVATPDQTFVLSLVDERGRELPAVDIDRKRYAIGEPGARYLLGIENHSAERYEVVASVDGLDVMNGSEAGFGHRGYILEPFSSLVIDGWRTSDDTVAAFRFSSIENSYAERRGKGRNIGVIGVAFFHEESAAPWSSRDRRHDADPFPNRYAPPPPPGW